MSLPIFIAIGGLAGGLGMMALATGRAKSFKRDQTGLGMTERAKSFQEDETGFAITIVPPTDAPLSPGLGTPMYYRDDEMYREVFY